MGRAVVGIEVQHLTPVVPSVSATTVASRHRAFPPASESNQYGIVSCKFKKRLVIDRCNMSLQTLRLSVVRNTPHKPDSLLTNCRDEPAICSMTSMQHADTVKQDCQLFVST